MPLLAYGSTSKQASLDLDIYISVKGEVQYTAKFDITCDNVEELSTKVNSIFDAFKDKYKSYKSSVNSNFDPSA